MHCNNTLNVSHHARSLRTANFENIPFGLRSSSNKVYINRAVNEYRKEVGNGCPYREADKIQSAFCKSYPFATVEFLNLLSIRHKEVAWYN